MTDITGRSLDYADEDEHILRRLGGAVVVHWKSLPKDVQDTLLEQAVFMNDRVPAVQLKQQIEAFIRVRALWQ